MPILHDQSLEISGPGSKPCGVVLGVAEHQVALAAQPSAKATARVTVVVMQPALRIGRSAADLTGVRAGLASDCFQISFPLSDLAVHDLRVVAALAFDVFAVGFADLFAVLVAVALLMLFPGLRMGAQPFLVVGATSTLSLSEGLFVILVVGLPVGGKVFGVPVCPRAELGALDARLFFINVRHSLRSSYPGAGLGAQAAVTGRRRPVYIAEAG